jgi:predicted nucleic-acid-binding protein
MKGIDTNILVRFLVQDDAEQARRATEFLTVECSADNPGFVNHIVLCELVWVLEGFYGYSRERVALALEGIIGADQLRIDEREDAFGALREYQDGADFPDALIGTANQRLGCAYTATFDRAAAKRTGFRAL